MRCCGFVMRVFSELWGRPRGRLDGRWRGWNFGQSSPNPREGALFELCPSTMDGGAGHHLGRHRHAAAVTRPDLHRCCTVPSAPLVALPGLHHDARWCQGCARCIEPPPAARHKASCFISGSSCVNPLTCLSRVFVGLAPFPKPICSKTLGLNSSAALATRLATAHPGRRPSLLAVGEVPAVRHV